MTMIDFGGGGGGGCQSFELTTGLWTHSKKILTVTDKGKKKGMKYCCYLSKECMMTQFLSAILDE